MRPFASALVSILLAATASAAFAADPKPGGAINVATVGEPPTLDPMESPADVVGIISQHIFETLYTWGDGWKVVPLLAASDAEISADGKTYTIPLRTGVKFHDGSDMTSEDVKASLERWMRVAQRGKQTAEKVASLEAPDANTIRIVLKEPFAPLLPLLSLQTSAAIILPAEKQAQPMTEFVGTGPYQFKERQPDQYVQLVRFDGYVAARRCRQHVWRTAGGLSGRNPLRAGPEREHSDRGRAQRPLSLRRRAAGRIPAASGGPGADRADRVQAVRLAAHVLQRQSRRPHRPGAAPRGAGEPQLRGHAGRGVRQHGLLSGRRGLVSGRLPVPQRGGCRGLLRPRGDPEAAQKLPAEAGYDGQPIRIMVSKQYDFHFKMAQVAAEYMRAAGFTVDLQVLDWATLLERRNDPASGRSSSPTARSCPSRPSTRS